jgi:D-sedoheptulose 7-phosphate isomerase
MDGIDRYLTDEAHVLIAMPRPPIARIVQLLRDARGQGRCIFTFGNGGSAATASHFVVDLVKGTLDEKKPRFRAICLNDNVPTLTAISNDVSYDRVFAEPLASLAQPGDVAIAISGSGNSANVLNAVRKAREMGLPTVGLTGGSGGALKDLVDICVIVPSSSMQLIEDAHLVILHAIFVELCRA